MGYICDQQNDRYDDISMSAMLLLSKKMVSILSEADELKRENKVLHSIKFKYNDKSVWAWIIWHENKFDQKGLFSKILKNLLNTWNKMKAKLKLLRKKRNIWGECCKKGSN